MKKWNQFVQTSHLKEENEEEKQMVIIINFRATETKNVSLNVFLFK